MENRPVLLCSAQLTLHAVLWTAEWAEAFLGGGLWFLAQRFLVFAERRMEQGEAGRFCVMFRAERGLHQPLAGTQGCKTTQPVENQVICNSTAYTQRDGEISALPQQPAEAAIKPVLITRDGRGNVHLIERKKAAVP